MDNVERLGRVSFLSTREEMCNQNQKICLDCCRRSDNDVSSYICSRPHSFAVRNNCEDTLVHLLFLPLFVSVRT